MGKNGIEQGTLEGFTVYSATKSFTEPKDLAYQLPKFEGDYSHQFLLKDPETGMLMNDVPYFVEVAGGRVFYGNTDEKGLTQIIYTHDVKDVEVHFGTDAEHLIEQQNQNGNAEN
jgi:uncharacterized protein (DUF2345 family)